MPRKPNTPSTKPGAKIPYAGFNAPHLYSQLFLYTQDENAEPVEIQLNSWREADRMRTYWYRYKTRELALAQQSGNPAQLAIAEQAAQWSFFFKDQHGRKSAPVNHDRGAHTPITATFSQNAGTDSEQAALLLLLNKMGGSPKPSTSQTPTIENEKLKEEQLNALNALKAAQSQAPQETDEDETSDENFLDEFGW